VTKTAKDDVVEAEKIEAVDTNIEAEEDFQEDEDDDGEKFALSIEAMRKEEDTQTEKLCRKMTKIKKLTPILLIAIWCMFYQGSLCPWKGWN
jgi:hypothetical protein